MKTVYRYEQGGIVSRKASDRDADKMLARGWLDHDPREPKPEPKKRGRPAKKVEADDNQA